MKKKSKKNKEQKKLKRKRLRRIIIPCILSVLLAGFLFGVVKLYPLYRDLSNQMYDILADMDETTFMRAGNTEIYDGDGNIIGRIGNEKYEYVKIKNISDYITNGYIAQEDKTFTTHHGVDLKATARAAIALLKNKGKITQGGSTITQQVVKNNLLTQEQTYKRKMLEILLAFEMEKEYTKAQIMEFYCNSNYYGNGCYGVDGASEYYFGKHAGDVTLAEAAILVGTSNSPNNYNPVADYEKAMEKKESVLSHMLECGYITQEEYDTAVAERPEIVQKSENIEFENYMVSYALHCTALKLMELDGFAFKYTFQSDEEYRTYADACKEAYQEAYDQARTGGYIIYTSFDQNMQNQLQQAVDENLSSFTEKGEDGIYELQGASVCIDNQTGLVKAIVGGREAAGDFNRGYQAKRQPGSTIKPLLDYGPALNEGFVSPATILKDEEITVDGYSPRNSNGKYRGNVTVREALARSINTIALQLFNGTGRDVCLSYLDRMQFSSLTFADSSIYATSIGGFTNGLTVDDMARGYATIANHGLYREGGCITKLESNREGLIYEDTGAGEQVYSEDTAFMLTDMMQGVFREGYGTAHKYDSDRFYAGKTGTTNDNKDAWFAGFSKYYTTVVWMGYDTPQEMDGVYGNSFPAEIWKSFMDTIHEGLDNSDFVAPPTIVLENGDGERMGLSTGGDTYAERPSGWDYISLQLEEKIKQNEKQREDAEILSQAENIVSDFENYQITDVNTAKGYEAAYNKAVDAVMKVVDEDKRVDLMERLAFKHELIGEDVLASWQQAEEEEQNEAQKIKDEQNVIAAQESLEKASQEAIESRISTARWYIDQLNSRSVYSEYVESMIANGFTAVEACNGYSDYASLKSDYDAAVQRSRSLPQAETSGQANQGSATSPSLQDDEEDTRTDYGSTP